jgi:hypothetical protein
MLYSPMCSIYVLGSKKTSSLKGGREGRKEGREGRREEDREEAPSYIHISF